MFLILFGCKKIRANKIVDVKNLQASKSRLCNGINHKKDASNLTSFLPVKASLFRAIDKRSDRQYFQIQNLVAAKSNIVIVFTKHVVVRVHQTT